MIANAPTFATLRIVITGAILRVVFDHPPLNLMDGAMFDDSDSDSLCEELHAFLVAFATQESKTNVRRALGLGFQTEEVESRSLDAWFPLLAANSSDRT